MASAFTSATRIMMERAEFVLQYSDGTQYDRVHGDPLRWFGGRRPRKLLDYNDLSYVKFKYYPVVYSEACYTTNFGPLLQAFIAQKTVYIGSTTPTYNNGVECDSWKTCHSCDGYKYGLLDLLSSRDTIGEVKRDVDAGLASTMNRNNLKQYKAMLNKNDNDPKTIELLSIIQNLMFGNPNRPVVLGLDAKKLTIKTIPVTLY